MREKTKVICFDVTAMPPNEVDSFYNHINGYAFLTEKRQNHETGKIISIRAFFGENDDFEKLLVGFSGVKYTDITGTDLLNRQAEQVQKHTVLRPK